MTTSSNIQTGVDTAPTSTKKPTGLQVWRLLDTPVWPLLAGILVVKLVLMTLFSSAYENDLFLPFIRHFLENFDNPWNYFHQHSPRGDEFPYQPLMLYILSAFCWPLEAFSLWDNVLVRNFIFKLPTLACDLGIVALMFRMFPRKHRHVLWFYFASPIILYACYMHSQLDLIPTMFLFASVFFITRQKWLPGSIFFGAALATKFHVLAALPLILLYLYRNQKIKQTLSFVGIAGVVYLAMAAPFLFSSGFQHLVLNNPKQSRIFEVFAQIGDAKIYWPILATLMIYGRFALYSKINADLLDSFLAVVFSVFVMLIIPSPAWYVWMIPFLSLFLIKHFRKNRQLLAPYLWLNGAYLAYFILFDTPEHIDLCLLSYPLQFKIMSDRLQGLFFTLLEGGLLANIILCYHAGVKSNAIYKRDRGVVIGIAGDSGAGKSTLLLDLKSLLGGRVVQLEGDADHKWERGDEHWQQLTHLDPKANFLHRQAETILGLKRGRPVQRSDYDHKTGQFKEPQLVQSEDFIIISGLHALYLPKLRKVIDLKIFMDPEKDLQIDWKLMRDTSERGYAAEKIVEQIKRREPDVSRFIAPQKDFADMVVRYFRKEVPSVEGDTPAAGAPVKGELSLKISLSSSVQLEELVTSLNAANAPFFWDYTEDLSKQEIVLFSPLPVAFIKTLAEELVPNADEVFGSNIGWAEGYRGFVQLIVLMSLSELMKEKEETDAV